MGSEQCFNQLLHLRVTIRRRRIMLENTDYAFQYAGNMLRKSLNYAQIMLHDTVLFHVYNATKMYRMCTLDQMWTSGENCTAEDLVSAMEKEPGPFRSGTFTELC